MAVGHRNYAMDGPLGPSLGPIMHGVIPMSYVLYPCPMALVCPMVLHSSCLLGVLCLHEAGIESISNFSLFGGFVPCVA